MKTKFIVVLFMIFISFFAKAEKTYLKDRTECVLNGEKIELEVRSTEQYSSNADLDYGQFIQINHKGKTIKVPVDNTIGRYRLLYAQNDLCTKPLALRTGSSEIAIFFSKDNRPFANTVMVLYYDLKSQSADFMGSKIQANNAFYSNGKAYFKLAASDNMEKFGTVIINGEKLNYIEKTFEPWISFDGKHFKFDRDMTYQRSEFKDFFKRSALDDLNEFQEVRYKFATDPKSGKRCLALHNGDWVCH